MQKPRLRWKRWTYKLFHRRVMVILLLLLQVVLMVYMHFASISAFRWMYTVSILISVVSLLFIITRQKGSVYKLPWVMLIAVMPTFGGLLFLFIHGQASSRVVTKRLREVDELLLPYLLQEEAVSERYVREMPAESQRSRYLALHGYPIYPAEDTIYLPSGEAMFEQLCAELQRAEKFILMEYFIVAEGEMWGEIHDILREKVAAGVEVKLIYDDMGSFLRQPYRYDRELCAEGIDTILFNPFRPVVSALQNNRDHRKITVIDGRVAFTGGVNIGDEYINRIERCGHWNDVSLMVTGGAVRSFTAMFLEMWLCNRPAVGYSIDRYFPAAEQPQAAVCARGLHPAIR